MFFLLVLAPPVRAQIASPTSADAIARKAYAARHDRFYALAGAAGGSYAPLNDFLRGTRFPGLRRGAFVAGVGYGQGWGAVGVQAEYRWGIRSHALDSSRAYTSLRSHSVSLLGSYRLMMRGSYVLSALVGPTYTVVDLTLREPDPRAVAVSSFAARLNNPGDRRRLYQGMALLSGGLQLDRHFQWGRRNDVQACGRARQLSVGLRAQFDYHLKSGKWRTERPLFRRPTYLGVAPEFNPLGFSATVVVAGMFSRY